jgi:hypothetical protein
MASIRTDPAALTTMLNAASMGRLAILDALIAAGANVNRPNTYKIAPLAAAAEQGQLEVVKRLIAAKADVNAQNDYGGSATIRAFLIEEARWLYPLSLCSGPTRQLMRYLERISAERQSTAYP